MLSRYSIVDIEDALRSASARPPFPTVQNRAAWDAIGHRLRDERVARMGRPSSASKRMTLTLGSTTAFGFSPRTIVPSGNCSRRLTPMRTEPSPSP